jgi:hypothetical protein
MISRFVFLCVGVIAGATVYGAATPALTASKKCEVFTVSREVATSYVLKPPQQEPIVIKEKCAAPITVSAPIETQAEEKPRVRHMRRHRRY